MQVIKGGFNRDLHSSVGEWGILKITDTPHKIG